MAEYHETVVGRRPFDRHASTVSAKASRQLFKEQPIYQQSEARTVREQREKRSCGWSRQLLKIEQLHCEALTSHQVLPRSNTH
jgi:hypothetical protein